MFSAGLMLHLCHADAPVQLQRIEIGIEFVG